MFKGFVNRCLQCVSDCECDNPESKQAAVSVQTPSGQKEGAHTRGWPCKYSWAAWRWVKFALKMIFNLQRLRRAKSGEREGLTCKEYGDRGSTEEGDGTELRVWAGERECTLTSPSGSTRTSNLKWATICMYRHGMGWDVEFLVLSYQSKAKGNRSKSLLKLEQNLIMSTQERFLPPGCSGKHCLRWSALKQLNSLRAKTF